MLYNPIQVLVVHLCKSSISNNLFDSLVLEKATGEAEGRSVKGDSEDLLEKNPDCKPEASSTNFFRELLVESPLELLASAGSVDFFLVTLGLVSGD